MELMEMGVVARWWRGVKNAVGVLKSRRGGGGGGKGAEMVKSVKEEGLVAEEDIILIFSLCYFSWLFFHLIKPK